MSIQCFLSLEGGVTSKIPDQVVLKECVNLNSFDSLDLICVCDDTQTFVECRSFALALGRCSTDDNNNNNNNNNSEEVRIQLKLRKL